PGRRWPSRAPPPTLPARSRTRPCASGALAVAPVTPRADGACCRPRRAGRPRGSPETGRRAGRASACQRREVPRDLGRGEREVEPGSLEAALVDEVDRGAVVDVVTGALDADAVRPPDRSQLRRRASQPVPVAGEAIAGRGFSAALRGVLPRVHAHHQQAHGTVLPGAV